MLVRRLSAFVLAVMTAGIVSACDHQSTEPPNLSASKTNDPATIGSAVAKSLAIAMGDRDVQESVKNAMRSSEMAQHKIQLQAFLNSDAGKPLASAAAEAANVSESDLLHIVSKLPPLDFFVPAVADRKQWRVGRPLAVGAVFVDDVWTTRAFTQAGDDFIYDGRKPNQFAFFLLMPEEPKMKRIHPQPNLDGDAIQDQGDGELSISVESENVPMAVRIGRDPDLPSTLTFDRSTSLTSSATGTYMYDFFPDGFDDGLSGQCEVHWEVYFVPAGTGSWTEHNRWKTNGEVSGVCGVPDATWAIAWGNLSPYQELSTRKMLNNYPNFPTSPNPKIAIEVWESDSSSGDDPQGWVDFYTHHWPTGCCISQRVYEHNHNPSRYSMRIEYRP